MTYQILAIGILFMIAFVSIRNKDGGFTPLILKILTSASFIGMMCAAYFKNQAAVPARFFIFMLLGGVFSLIGDALLDLKVTYLQDADKYLFGGMIAFSIAQMFYFTNFIFQFGFHWSTAVIAIVIGVGSVVIMNYVMKIKTGKFSQISAAYGSALAFSMCVAVFAVINKGANKATITILVGSIMFLISDLILAMTYFDGKDGKFMIVSNHITYYAAQFLYALSILFLAA